MSFRFSKDGKNRMDFYLPTDLGFDDDGECVAVKFHPSGNILILTPETWSQYDG
jgi:hypothetical protein